MDKPNVQSKTKFEKPAKRARSVRADGASTRALILDATSRRLIEQGYANLNVRDIAADAGVNHALISYHFRGKQPLVLAVLDEANARLLARQAGMYAKPDKASEKWQQACDFYKEDLDSGFVKLLMELMAGSFHDEELRREFTPRLLAWQKLIEGAVDEFVGGNNLKLPIGTRAISSWITWFWIGMEASMALRIPEHEGHQQEALQAMALILRQVEAAEAPRNRQEKS